MKEPTDAELTEWSREWMEIHPSRCIDGERWNPLHNAEHAKMMREHGARERNLFVTLEYGFRMSSVRGDSVFVMVRVGDTSGIIYDSGSFGYPDDLRATVVRLKAADDARRADHD